MNDSSNSPIGILVSSESLGNPLSICGHNRGQRVNANDTGGFFSQRTDKGLLLGSSKHQVRCSKQSSLIGQAAQGAFRRMRCDTHISGFMYKGRVYVYVCARCCTCQYVHEVWSVSLSSANILLNNFIVPMRERNREKKRDRKSERERVRYYLKIAKLC